MDTGPWAGVQNMHPDVSLKCKGRSGQVERLGVVGWRMVVDRQGCLGGSLEIDCGAGRDGCNMLHHWMWAMS